MELYQYVCTDPKLKTCSISTILMETDRFCCFQKTFKKNYYFCFALKVLKRHHNTFAKEKIEGKSASTGLAYITLTED